ncbi:DNA polymerase III subunit gamma [Candidatus Portiera aleyrodidarum]|uniref:DNA polymerase III subunit gamma/tau n=1 Tax=Candidatus Portiera aleyrodidarum TaxID=91844 RepID=UPI0005D79D85|nr:DNA polymerase III subunit gamma/tau [Candidatus Portiera aleyrodidarum]CEL12424.1 DNA polymerase III subunit gamma [Candidatus Portiera aleyrodidarum]
MSYKILALKLRPKKLDDVIGQNHVIKSLKSSIKNYRLHHAYIFTGSRGVGKTTLARIFAKCLNCEKGILINSCEKCKNCKLINLGKFSDLIEVDAASRTKVEETKELLEDIKYPPINGRYKIYLIDEVHMLSLYSFNALLKTLEEPPEYIKFLLATTKFKKIPITILSRCLQFNLKLIPFKLMLKYLKKILFLENILIENNALNLICKLSKGSMRDALSIIEQAIIFCGKKIKEKNIINIIGVIDKYYIYLIVKALIKNDIYKILELIINFYELGVDFIYICDELIILFHKIFLSKLLPNYFKLINEDLDEDLIYFSKNFTIEEIKIYYKIILKGRKTMLELSDLKSGLEMILLNLIFLKKNQI